MSDSQIENHDRDSRSAEDPPTVQDLASVTGALEIQRRALLDIGKRNPLTNAPLNKNPRNQLLIVDELSEEIFRILGVEEKKLTFLPKHAKDDDNDTELNLQLHETKPDQEDLLEEIYVPDELEKEVHAKHTDTKFQTELTPAELQKKLLYLYREARTIEEEQGISVLFLALGFLRYYESESSEIERFAPLILLPVELSRDNSRGIFRLSIREADIESNRSMIMMLLEDHDLLIPELPEEDDWQPSDYFETLDQAISSKPRWQVERDRMSLSFFSFGKFLMYRDLDLGSNGDSVGNVGLPLVETLLTGRQSNSGTVKNVSITAPEQNINLDAKFSDPRDLGHILDADTSQTKVIAAAMEGESLVVQGPPGTGKSQTIANIIAAAANQGKRVLFIAEKRAALDVVMKRLAAAGLGPLCLELHSHKANRKQFYADLKTTLELGKPTELNDEDYQGLREVRDQLNHLANLVHSRDTTTGNTAFRMMGRISQLLGRQTPIADFAIEGIDTWSITEFDKRAGLVSRFAALTAEYGSEHEHLWRGVNRRLDVVDQQRLRDLLAKSQTIFSSLVTSYEHGSQLACWESALSEAQVTGIIEALRGLAVMPAEVQRLVESATAIEFRSTLTELCQHLCDLQELERKLDTVVSASGFDMDWDRHLLAMQRDGSSWLRWFKGSFRQAGKQLNGVLKTEVKGLEERIAVLHVLVQIRAFRTHITDADALGREHFGVGWQRFNTDAQASLQAFTWLNSQIAILANEDATQKQVQQHDSSVEYTQLADELAAHLGAWQEVLNGIVQLTRFDAVEAFGEGDSTAFALNEVAERFAQWLTRFDQLTHYHELLTTGSLMTEEGIGAIREHVSQGLLDTDKARDTFTLLRSEAVLRNIQNEFPDLRTLNQFDRSDLVNRFRDLDSELQQLTAQEIALRHYEDVPRGSSGQMGIIRGEIAKKRRQMPIRRLLDTAGDVIAALKPVFLMSPLSVAQYLKPDGLRFDLLLIDEASQVKPAEALGAIMRAKQIVVVGDQKQMPPTAYFDRQITGDDADEDADEELDNAAIQARQSADMESILSLCDARSLTNAMLSWHYRSEHPSLIEVSNHEFYDGKLTYPPSPDFDTARTGLSMVHVEDGVYSRGKRRNNEKEADRICEYVVRHIQETPHLSLGVVGLSTSQRDLIQTKIDQCCRENPDVERFCAEIKSGEQFFVKNLENVQGDERDVIYVSIGYGKDANGYFAQSFGPVSTDGGERRLNVLFTRARKQCTIFASITHDDINTNAAKFNGPRVLKQFLKYAATGERDVPVETGEEMDSPFEEDVAAVLERYGYDVRHQVGSVGFKIDLTIIDPDDDKHFLLAIECDGARYHSSSWARERDRLRQQVLEGKGWRFHRIWSTDWFYDRENEIQRLLRAIAEARELNRARNAGNAHESTPGTSHGRAQTGFKDAVLVGSSEGGSSITASDSNSDTKLDSNSPPSSQERVVTRDPIERSSHVEPETSTVPYHEASITINPVYLGYEIHEVRDDYLIRVVQEIVSQEAPVHVEVVIGRIAQLWDKQRAGKRIRSKILGVISNALLDGVLKRDSDQGQEILINEKERTPIIRDRSNVSLTKVKWPEHIALSEYHAAIKKVVNENYGLTITQCAKEIARLFGTNLRRDSNLEITDRETRSLADAGTIGRTGDRISRVR